MEHIYDILIIGGGPAGYTAALYGARAGLSVLVLEKLSAGGQMALSEQIDNYPGFEAGIDGFTLAEKMEAGARRFGAETELADVTGLELSGAVKTAHTSEGDFHGRALILATGANHKELGLPGESALLGRGVHACAACDGMAYKGKTVAVVGGGNSAAADALLLSRICEKVIVIHRRDTLRADKVYHAQLEAAPTVEFRWNTTVSALQETDGKFSGLTLRDVHTGAETALPCDGVFISIGRTPATDLVQGKLDTDAAGYILADETTCTAIPGVFAAGDVRAKSLRQIVTAVSDGANAAHAAEAYLASQG